jgi:hypothetical protein
MCEQDKRNVIVDDFMNTKNRLVTEIQTGYDELHRNISKLRAHYWMGYSEGILTSSDLYIMDDYLFDEATSIYEKNKHFWYALKEYERD